MRLRSFHPPHPFGKINVTPMIDVVMCLIVFYLIVGKLAADQRSAIRLPASATGAEEKAQDLLIVNVMPGSGGEARIVIDAVDIPPDQLAAAIKDRIGSKPGVVVELRGSRELAYGAVAGVIRACKEAGVESVRLAAERAGRCAMSGPFRRRSALHAWELHFGPNMTPMVDVVMVILIFFMASATFAGSEWFLRTAIPRPAAEKPPKDTSGDPYKLPPARFELTLARGTDGRTVVTAQGFEPASIPELPARLADLARGTSPDDIVLVIRAAADVPYNDVIRAHDAATGAGITKVGLMDAPN